MIKNSLFLLHRFILKRPFLMGFMFAVVTFSGYIFESKSLSDDIKQGLSKNYDNREIFNKIRYYRY